MAFMVVYLSGCIMVGQSDNTVSNKEKADTLLQLGVRYLELNEVEYAREELNHAINLDANNAKIHNALGGVYERLRQHKIADKHYKLAISIAADDISVNNNYGRFLCEKDQYQEGFRLLKKALIMPLNHRKWFTYTLMGICELKHNKKITAETYFRRALQQNQKYPVTLAQMQKISYTNEKFLLARGFLARYLAVANHTAETLWYAIQTELALGNEALLAQYKHRLFTLFPASKESKQLQNIGDYDSKNSNAP